MSGAGLGLLPGAGPAHLDSPGPAPRAAFPCSHGAASPARKFLGRVIYPCFPASC